MCRRSRSKTADPDELQSLTPPFRLFRDQDLTGCGRDGTTVTQDLDYYITHSATACAQACIAWNASGRDCTPCNAAVYKAALGEPARDPDTFINSTGSSNTYHAWNCWLKVIKDICGPAPPPASVAAASASMLIMDSDQFPCAPLSLHRSLTFTGKIVCAQPLQATASHSNWHATTRCACLPDHVCSRVVLCS